MCRLTLLIVTVMIFANNQNTQFQDKFLKKLVLVAFSNTILWGVDLVCCHLVVDFLVGGLHCLKSSNTNWPSSNRMDGGWEHWFWTNQRINRQSRFLGSRFIFFYNVDKVEFCTIYHQCNIRHLLKSTTFAILFRVTAVIMHWNVFLLHFVTHRIHLHEVAQQREEGFVLDKTHFFSHTLSTLSTWNTFGWNIEGDDR